MVGMGHARVSWARAKRRQSSGRGKRPGGFDPEELFGAAWWLTRMEKVAAQQTSVRACVPVVTARKSTYFFPGDVPPLDFRGHRVVRAADLKIDDRRTHPRGAT